MTPRIVSLLTCSRPLRSGCLRRRSDFVSFRRYLRRDLTLLSTPEYDPGCVKTCTEQKSLESFSRMPPVQRPPRHSVPERKDVSPAPEVCELRRRALELICLARILL